VKSIKLVFHKPNLLVDTKDLRCYSFSYIIEDSFIPLLPNVSIKSYECKVYITNSLKISWRLKDDSLIIAIFEFVKESIVNKINDGTLNDEEEIWLTANNTPISYTKDISDIKPMSDKTEVTIPITKNNMLKKHWYFHASSIIDIRDNINALTKEKYHENLLILVQERLLLELLRDADSHEEFMHRVAALSILASEFNVPLLRKMTGIADTKYKSIDLLEEYFKLRNCNRSRTVDILRNINRIRKGYPIHGDHLGGVLSAYKFFAIDYPINDYDHAWFILVTNCNILK